MFSFFKKGSEAASSMPGKGTPSPRQYQTIVEQGVVIYVPTNKKRARLITGGEIIVDRNGKFQWSRI